jgi:hypothetical protein
VAEAPSSAIPALPGLAVETVEWLPSGAESGLVRVRGRWVEESARHAELPVLALRAGGAEHRFDSLPDARFSRDPASWRGTYLVPAALVAGDEPEALWLEWADGARSGLPALARGIEPPPVQSPPASADTEEAGGEVIDRAVLAERRARRAEAAERQQARVAEEALKAVEVLELRSAELERRLEEAVAERDALAARQTEEDERRGALAAALASAADLRSRAREWQLRMRTHEVARAGDAVRLAVLEAERATNAPALRAALDEAKDAAVAARQALSETDERFASARDAWDRRHDELEAELREVRAALEEARGFEARLQVETVARTTLEDELDRERAARATLRRELDNARAERDAALADAATLPDLRVDLEAARAEAATVPDLRADLEAARADLEAVRAEVASLPDLRAELDAARAEAAPVPGLRAELDAARAAAATAHADLEAMRADLDARRADFEAARQKAASLPDVRAELEVARAEAASLPDLRAELDAARADAASLPDLRANLEAARAEAASLPHLRAELEAARGEVASIGGLRADLETERAARRAAEETVGETAALHERIAELERRAQTGREDLERLAREQAAAAAAREPGGDPTRLVADLDAAAEALRSREPVAPDEDTAVEAAQWPAAPAPAEPATEPADAAWTVPAPPVEPVAPDAEPAVESSAPDDEPAAPDAEPAVEWSEAVDSERRAVTPGVERVRDGESAPDADWSRAGFPHAPVAVEPPAPDAEPYVEWTPPETNGAAPPADASSTVAPEPSAVAEPSIAADPTTAAEPSIAADPTTAVVAEPPEVVPSASAPVAAPPAGPLIVPAAKPPARGLMLGTDRRDYPLLRGAIVKLAHDDPRLAGRLLAALLPAQGTAIDGPLGYDLTIAGTGTYGVGIAAGRATVEPLKLPRGRHAAEFHLTADPLVLAELLAGVDHRIGRFFGPARVKGRKRRAKATVKQLQTSTASLADAGRAGADLDPELVYRAFAYAVHPSWTRGHTFTIAQEIEGDPPETWYLTAGDGAGLTVSAKPPDRPPAAAVEMSRETFRKLLRGDAVPPGQRPCVRGDRTAVAHMVEWIQRARANA